MYFYFTLLGYQSWYQVKKVLELYVVTLYGFLFFFSKLKTMSSNIIKKKQTSWQTVLISEYSTLL